MIKNLALRGGSSRTLLLVSLLLGVFSAILIGVFLSQAGGKSSGGASATTRPVVVAAQDIAASTRVTAGMVTLKNITADAVVAGAFTDTGDVVGQVTQVPIVAGEQVLPSKVTATGVAIAQFGDDPPLSLIVPQGQRAFSLALSPIAAAGGLIRAGDFVDVILSAATNEEASGFLTPGAGCYVAQDVQVLAVGSDVKNTTTSDASGIASSKADATATAATLAVTPDEAWYLAAAQQSVDGTKVGNQLWLSLRPFGEHGQSSNLPICGVIPGS